MNTEPPTDQWLTIHGRRIRVRVRPGTGTGPPLLLCNGIGAPLEVLQPLVDQLPAERTVIRFDVPGVGGSDTPRLPYHLSQLACTLAELLRQLGFDRIDVAGYSWGGGLAQQLAAQHPRLVRRLVLLCTGTGTLMVPAHPRVLSKMLTPRRHHDPDYAATIAPDLYGGTMRDHPDDARTLLGGRDPAEHRRGYLFQLAAVVGWTSLPWLWTIRQPTLLVFGSDDPLIPLVNGRIMRGGLPRAELYVFDGGHLGPVTQPGEIAGVIDRFLSN